MSPPIVSTTPMRPTLLVNPIAGGGRAARAAAALAERLDAAGHACAVVPTRPGGDGGWLDAALVDAACDLLVVVGGDGAVRLASGAAARRAIAIWQVPMGTENLFAREWGMDRSAESLLRAMDRGEIVETDLGMAGSSGAMPGGSAGIASAEPAPVEPFTLMASIGFDAQVVHALAAGRSGGISHWSYAGPIVRALRRHVAPRLHIEADGRRVDDGRRGFAIVANGRQYAVGINPAHDASVTDGLLDVLWFPGDGVWALLGWLARCLVRRHVGDPRLVRVRARTVTVGAEQPFLYQLDGDAPWTTGPGVGVRRLEIEVRPGVLRVLRPASAPTCRR